MKYISLFSGIGAFEFAIKKDFVNWDCVGFSEINLNCLKLYKKHFPEHAELGDITKIKENDIKKVDLVVAGFPCTNLSSMCYFRGNKQGINGPKSGLFYDLVRVLNYAFKKNPNLKFIIENNNSMKKSEKEKISNILKENFKNTSYIVLNNGSFGVQTTKRIIWSNLQIEPVSFYLLTTINALASPTPLQTWKDVLEPLNDVFKYKLSDKMIECLNKTYPCLKLYEGKVVVKKRKFYTFQKVENKTR